jgi:hypothetical protein
MKNEILLLAIGYLTIPTASNEVFSAGIPCVRIAGVLNRSTDPKGLLILTVRVAFADPAPLDTYTLALTR